MSFLFCWVFFNNLAFAETSHSRDHIRSCSPQAGNEGSDIKLNPEGLDYNPAGADFELELENGYCWTIITTSYVAVKAAICVMNKQCETGSCAIKPSPIADFASYAKALPKILTGDNACRLSIAAAGSAIGVFAAEMKIFHSVAEAAQKETRLCGANWTKWNSKEITKNNPGQNEVTENTIKEWIAACKSNANSTECIKYKSGLNNQQYREWYYGGVEREDNSIGACPDVTKEFVTASEGDQLKSSHEGYPVQYNDRYYPAQTYYMRGTEPANYACDRFNPAGKGINTNAYKDAHQCCINKSKSTVCIERGDEHQFCTAGNECSLGSVGNLNEVIYAPSYKGDNNQMICVSSVSMCPYNFNIGGGNTECDYFKDGSGSPFTPIKTKDVTNGDCAGGKSEIRNNDCSINNKAGRCKNYCQLLNHCVIVGGNDYVYNTNISSPYFSSACLDFVGDSKNSYDYNTGFLPGPSRHFTAPIAQCVRETLENVFYNKAGHTLCGTAGEYPDQNGVCPTDFYQYQKDRYVSGTQSFFSYIQEKVKDSIKLVLTISIMMQGLKILLTGSSLKQPELIMYVVKIGMVLFFATGTAWQGYFFNGVYNVSSTFSTIVMNIKTSSFENQRDGCQFGKIALSDGSKATVSEYPSGKEYLSMFDTFDCKIARYLGFGPSASVANIAKLALASFIFPAAGAIGVYFAVMTMMFGFFIIVAAFRALHIFLTSAFAIILMVYVSPITITTSLFERTKNIFEGWLKNLIGFSLQPIILFAYVGFFITIFETLVTGSATFSGKAPQKELICDKVCIDISGAQTTMNNNEVCEIENGSKILDPMTDSIACIMNLKNEQFGRIPVLEPIGIALPMLINFFSESGREKILTMTKGLLIIYILAKFMDQIPGIASRIMGGATLPGGGAFNKNALGMAIKVAGLVSSVQKRALGSSRKIAKGLVGVANRDKNEQKE